VAAAAVAHQLFPRVGHALEDVGNGFGFDTELERRLPEEDARYAAQVVAQRTGMSQQDAEKRVNETFSQVQAKKQEVETKAREAADAARKASAAAALALFLSLLIGAFVASYSAIVGGRQRDD